MMPIFAARNGDTFETWQDYLAMRDEE